METSDNTPLSVLFCNQRPHGILQKKAAPLTSFNKGGNLKHNNLPQTSSGRVQFCCSTPCPCYLFLIFLPLSSTKKANYFFESSVELTKR